MTDPVPSPRTAPPDLGEDLLAFCEKTRTVLWVYDVDRNLVVYVSQAYEELWGRPAAQLYEEPAAWHEGVHEDDIERVQQAERDLREGHYDIQFRIRRPDGTLSWVHSQAVSVREAPDGGRRVMGFVQDRSTRHSLDAPLNAISSDLPDRFEDSVHAILRLLVEETGATLVFLGQVDPDDPNRVRIVHARNAEGAQQPFVYDLPGSPCEVVFANRLCCYPRGVTEAFPQGVALRTREVEGYLGVPLATASGDVLGIMVALFDEAIENEVQARTLFRVCGARIGAAMANHEVQATLERSVNERTRALETVNRRLRTSQERYRVFVQRSSVGIWCLELPVPVPLDLPAEDQLKRIAQEARLVECNDVVALRLGHGSGGEVRGMGLSSLPSFWPEANQSLLLDTIERGYDLTDVAREVSMPDGSVRHLRVDLVPIREGNGLVRLWCTERDVTERVQDEESLAKRTSSLMHFSRMNTLGEMSAGIAHEINQPLGAIVNYARGCSRRLGDECDADVKGALDSIVEQADRAGASLRRLRGFTATAPQSPEVCSAAEIVRNAAQLIAHRQQTVGAELFLDLHPPSDLVLADSIQVEQVVIQLLRNAYDALEADDVAERRVTVRLEPTSRGVQVTVKDSGPGLTPSERDHAFDPFFSTRTDGVGLGLTVSRSVIESHGGRLWYAPANDSDDPQGAAFCFTLPNPSGMIHG
jgi:PAS domain S-box-containing protein